MAVATGVLRWRAVILTILMLLVIGFGITAIAAPWKRLSPGKWLLYLYKTTDRESPGSSSLLGGTYARTDLYFRAGGASPVSDVQFNSYVDANITPFFPLGATVESATTRSRNGTGGIVAEVTYVVTLLYSAEQAALRSASDNIESARVTYRTLFRQNEVVRVDSRYKTGMTRYFVNTDDCKYKSLSDATISMITISMGLLLIASLMSCYNVSAFQGRVAALVGTIGVAASIAGLVIGFVYMYSSSCFGSAMYTSSDAHIGPVAICLHLFFALITLCIIYVRAPRAKEMPPTAAADAYPTAVREQYAVPVPAPAAQPIAVPVVNSGSPMAMQPYYYSPTAQFAYQYEDINPPVVQYYY